LNADRNKILHPVQEGKLKQGAIVPSSASKHAADKFYRNFCHVIDLAGERSPRSEEKELNQYVEERKTTSKSILSNFKIVTGSAPGRAGCVGEILDAGLYCRTA